MRFLLTLLVLTAVLRAEETTDLAGAWSLPDLQVAVTGETPLLLTVKNLGARPVTIRQPAGLICKATAGEARNVTLRAFEITVAAGATGEATLPAAHLRGEAFAAGAPLQPTNESEPRLAGLLDYFATHNDVPRLTAQLLVACVLDDVTFAAWLNSPGVAPASEPAPTQVVAAIDALGVLQSIAPDRKFALAADSELKLRALRNPVARAKAMQLYGLALPDAPLPPELSTLLHTKPGDNCPICRQRALMQPREDGL